MRVSFRWKIAALTASVAAVPLLVVGYLLIDVNAREVETSSRQLQIALTGQVADRVEDDLGAAERDLAAIGAALTETSMEEPARLALALRLLDASAALDVVAVYDASGAAIDRMREPPAAEIATPARLPAALREDALARGVAIAPAERSGDGARVLVVRPLRASALHEGGVHDPTHRGDDDGAQLTGWVAAPVSLARAQALVERLSRAHLGSERSTLMLVDAERRILAHPDRARILEPASQAALPADLARLGPRAASSGEGVAPDGTPVVATIVALSSAPWAVVAQVPTSRAYASLAQMRRIVTSTIAITIALALLASFFLARRLASPIGALVAFTRDLAARRFDRRVRIDTRDELATLGDALSDAARELQGSEARIREETAIRSDLGRYLPAELVDKIVKREQSMALGGRRLPITVLFADVVAFTPLSEKLPPEEVVSLLNELFTLLTEAVFRHGGTVDKFVGDCVMALFGAPEPRADHAARALATAQDMLRFLETANDGWQERFGTRVQLAIGVHSGEAVVGNVGSETRMEYTAIGDVVNVAARLETIARPQQILVSRATAQAAGDAFDTAPIGAREVPGRAEPIELFEVRW